MKIKSLHIKNFKSIVDLTINEPNPFTVFVGPNGSGKSNIFEALECLRNFSLFGIYKKNSFDTNVQKVLDLYGGKSTVFNFNRIDKNLYFKINDNHNSIELEIEPQLFLEESHNVDINNNILNTFHRIFIGRDLDKILNNGDLYLNNSINNSNLEKVLKRLLENKEKREEISEWLELFLPEFDRIEVQKSEFSSNENLLIYQKHYERPFNKELISDGTYNIIALLTAVYQSDEPQFLCIEEPENGLHPFVQKELVNFFRWACEEYGHYIWLNTHSQSIVSQLTKDEIITVNKEKGETIIKQHKDTELYGLPIDEAWLNKVLGGSTKWL